MQARSLTKLGIFPDQSNQKFWPSFADGLVDMDHSFDATLLELYKHVDMEKSNHRRSNPEPTTEKTAFDSLSQFYQQEMIVRNILLLSRLFIRNAKVMNLLSLFVEKKQINILDLGCDNAPSLLGILAMFGVNRVKYVGVDFYKPCIDECCSVYDKLADHADIKFIEEDARSFLSKPENIQQFDLVLIQHPNLQSDGFKPIFTDIFLQVANVISAGGILYSTFYLEKEAHFFRDRILPLMKDMQDSRLIKSNAYDNKVKLTVDGELASSENFIFISPQLNLEPAAVPMKGCSRS